MKITDWILNNDVGDIFNNKKVSTPDGIDDVKLEYDNNYKDTGMLLDKYKKHNKLNSTSKNTNGFKTTRDKLSSTLKSNRSFVLPNINNM